MTTADRTPDTKAAGPLAGIRVVDFCAIYAGPMTCSLLGQMGAEVIRVETQVRPDALRTSRVRGGTANPGFHILNHNKRGITLNLRRPEANALVKRLIAISDVVVENFRPGVMESLGLAYEELSELNPDLVMLSLSAMGDSGPERKYGALAVTFSALSGLSHLTGYPGGTPTEYRGSSDFRSGFAATFATIAALYHRQQTGRGQHVDLSAREALSCLVGDALMDYSMNGRVRGPAGNLDEQMAPHGCYPSAGDDHWVSIAVGTEDEWHDLCDTIGRPELTDDPRFRTAEGRRANIAELDAIISEWTAQRSDYEAMQTLQAAGVAASVTLRSDQIVDDPHLAARGFIQRVELDPVGPFTLIDTPWKLSGSPGLPPAPGPLLGEANDYVFSELLGLSEDEIQSLVDAEVIY